MKTAKYTFLATACWVTETVCRELKDKIGVTADIECTGCDKLAGNLKITADSDELLARANHFAGAGTPFTPEGTLEDAAKRYLETAAEKYREADYAFGEFDPSFGTPQEQNIKQGWLNLLFLFWTDAVYKLAVDSHNKGNAILSKVDRTNPDKDATLQGLRTWDTALRHYCAVLEIIAKAKKQGVAISPDYIPNAQRLLIDVTREANGFANAIDEPKLAEGYTQIQQSIIAK